MTQSGSSSKTIGRREFGGNQRQQSRLASAPLAALELENPSLNRVFPKP
jgi:hypothetical protein